MQKEEYIALAINKYILHTGSLPKLNNFDLDWNALLNKEYLGEHFNKENLFTHEDMLVKFNESTYEALFYTVNKNTLSSSSLSKVDNRHLYHFYKSTSSREYTQLITQEDNPLENDSASSFVIYGTLQKEMVNLQLILR